MAGAGGKVTVLINGSIVTMDKELRVFLRNGAIAVVGDKIAAIGKTGEILSAYESKADAVLDLSSRWIMPGTFFSRRSLLASSSSISLSCFFFCIFLSLSLCGVAING